MLDTGDYWSVEDFQLEAMSELFAGYREVWEIIPEGNTKTTLMGGASLYFGDYTQDAAVGLAAASRDQCGLLFGQAAGFVRRSPGFNRVRFRVFDGYRKIRCLRTDGVIQVFAADEDTGDGIIPTLCLVDELHRHRSLALYRTWVGKLEKRGGQIAVISTAGAPGSEFEMTREQMRKTVTDLTTSRNGRHTRAATERTVINDYRLRDDDDPEDLEAVKDANPFSGITVETLRAKRNTPTMTLAHWRRFTCNLATRDEDAAITEAEWARAKSAERIPVGEPVFVGADFAWKWDTTALVPVWMPSLHRRLIGVPEVLTPPRDNSSMDPELVKDAFRRLHARNPIHTVVMDESAGGAQLARWIVDELGATVVEHSQGHSAMSLAYERWMEALRNGWLCHPDDPVLTQHVLNAVARLLPGGQVRFDRPSGARNAKVAQLQEARVWDALTAASMAHSVAVAVYEAPVVKLSEWLMF